MSTQLVYTPHPVLLDGRRHAKFEMAQGETLADILARELPDNLDDGWEVRIGGHVVPHEHLARVRPKDGQIIEVRGAVNRQALYLVAMIALTYFTFGAGATAGGIFGTATGAGTFYGASGLMAATLATGTVMAGSALGGRVTR